MVSNSTHARAGGPFLFEAFAGWRTTERRLRPVLMKAAVATRWGMLAGWRWRRVWHSDGQRYAFSTVVTGGGIMPGEF